MWQCLKEQGFGDICVGLIQQLYRNHRRKVKTVAGLTEWVPCSKGLKQGCVLSPLLFALYINELGVELEKLGGVRIGDVVIPAIFFADDIVLLA